MNKQKPHAFSSFNLDLSQEWEGNSMQLESVLLIFYKYLGNQIYFYFYH